MERIEWESKFTLVPAAPEQEGQLTLRIRIPRDGAFDVCPRPILPELTPPSRMMDNAVESRARSALPCSSASSWRADVISSTSRSFLISDDLRGLDGVMGLKTMSSMLRCWARIVALDRVLDLEIRARADRRDEFRDPLGTTPSIIVISARRSRTLRLR
jgi:hypothetical protein